jgi:MEDS: MEthanogen/methylotroph, DcmR Sensory domain
MEIRYRWMSPWERLLEKPHARGHVVQLSPRDDRQSLIRNVTLYLSQGLSRGQGVLVIATPEHWKGFTQELNRLGAEIDLAVREKRLVYLDAQETLSRLMTAGQPDWDKFESAIGGAMRRIRSQKENSGPRAYGEMVSLLWNSRRFAAAVRLEQFWNRLLAQSSFSLYCSYSIDIFDTSLQVAALDDVLCNHSHLLPTESEGNLEKSIGLAMDEVLGAKAHGLRLYINENPPSSCAVMPNTEASILWIRRNLPDQSEHIIGRAREHYRRLVQRCEPLAANP